MYLWCKYMWKWERDTFCKMHPAMAELVSHEAGFFFAMVFLWVNTTLEMAPVVALLNRWNMRWPAHMVVSGLPLIGMQFSSWFFTEDPIQC